jgi:hypothetical protein
MRHVLYAAKWDNIILVLFDGNYCAHILTNTTKPSNEIPIIYLGSSQFKFK